MTPEIDPVSRADMNPQLGHALADGLAVSEVSRLNPPQANPDAGFGSLVAQAGEPLGERFDAVLPLIPQEFH